MISFEQQQCKEFEILRPVYNGDEERRQNEESLRCIRNHLVRLLASSKRAAYTRQLLNKRFAAERRRLLNQSKNCCTSSISFLPRDNGKTRQEIASIKLPQKKKWIKELEKGMIPQQEPVTDGNIHGYENDKRSSIKSTKYNERRLSLTVIEDEDASPVHKGKFEW